jgi:hypothetical protein
VIAYLVPLWVIALSEGERTHLLRVLRRTPPGASALAGS